MTNTDRTELGYESSESQKEVLSSQFWAFILAFHVYILTVSNKFYSFHTPAISFEVSGFAEKADDLLFRSKSEPGQHATAMQEREQYSNHES